MRLDRSTYEAWLLDRIEGMLTSGQERELDAFLKANTDLRTTISDLPHVKGGEEAFPMKAALHRDLPPTGAPDAARLTDFLAARLEGGLSAEQDKQLDLYLYEHPEAVSNASLMAQAKLSRETILFGDKACIERHFPPRGLPDTYRLVDFLIADGEGDLDADQHAALELYLHEHSEAHREQQLVAATFVEPTALVYTGKDTLKKRAVRVVPLWPRMAAAASIAVLLSAGWWLLRDVRQVERAGIAQVEQPLPPETAGRQHPRPEAPEAQVLKIAPEVPTSQTDVVENTVEPKATTARQGSHTPPKEQPSVEGSPRSDPAIPILEPIERITLGSIPDQALAQISIAESGWTIAQAMGSKPATGASISSADEGENIGTFLANKMRSDVLVAPQRDVELDGADALAMADKAIGKITGGQGGVDIHRSATRERIQLRLGRNFSLSASRGR